MSEYEAIIFLSDGSIPFLFAQKNFIHFQVPFMNINGKSNLNKIKLKRIQKIFCNSNFTKNFIDSEFGISSEVIYPPVDVENLKPDKKKNIILSVGRLGESLNNKKQEILLEVFIKLCKQGLKNWQFIIVGGVKSGDEKYLSYLKQMAIGFPVKFLINTNFDKLKNIYGQSQIFWHAAGYGEDEQSHPERMEHFGIVVVEAMAAGCIPIVIGKGGIPEIISQGINGLLWNTKSELANKTLQLIKSKQLIQKLSFQAIKDSQKFNKKIFCSKINALMEDK